MKKVLLLGCLLASVWVQAQIPGNVPAQGLVAYYGFNGNIQDASTANNHLTQVGTTGVTATTDRFGNPNSAYEFGGAGYFTNTAPSFTLSPTQPFTMSAWVLKTGGTVAVMVATNVANNFITILQSGTTNTQFGTNKQQSAWIWAQTTNTLNVWEHYTCVYEAPLMKLYKNGVLAATNTFTHTATNSVNLPLWIGRGVGGGNWLGKIDEVAFWNRALDSNEVALLFTGCGARLSQQPASQNVIRNQSALFVTGGAAATVQRQWQVNTGTGFTNIAIGNSRYQGADSDSLRVLNADFDLQQAQFRCIVTATGCADTSQAASLNVRCNTMLENQPLSASVRMQESISFRVSSFDAQASFQWQVNNGTGFANVVDGPNIQGAQNDTLRLSNVGLGQNGDVFRCIISRTPCNDTSGFALLTVINTTSVGELAGLNWKVYPNPTSSTWQVVVPESTEAFAWQLLNVQGQRLAAGSWTSGQQQLDASPLPAGMYWLLVPGRGQMRLVKQ